MSVTLTASEAGQLERLSLCASAGSPGAAAALRHVNTRGHGLEFQDYRAYQPGDDPRAIDWTVDARLRQLVVRVRRAEARVRLHLLVDTSRSMAAGRPDKIGCATRLAAAFAYVASQRRDPIGAATFDEQVRLYLPAAAGRHQMHRVLNALASARPDGRSAPDAALMGYGSLVRGPALAVVLSDFFHGGGGLNGLRFLMYRGLQPAVVQILADEELTPAFEDDTELTDLEDADAPPVVVDAGAIAAYVARLRAASQSLQGFCHTHGLPFVQVTASMPFAALVGACQRAGLLAVRA